MGNVFSDDLVWKTNETSYKIRKKIVKQYFKDILW
jgi:hypothetical protein